MKHKIKFNHDTIVEVEANELLSEALDVTNSPILFGCRTGICATCIVQVHAGAEHLPPITAEEKEVLEAYTDKDHCRLACQLTLSGDVELSYLGK